MILIGHLHADLHVDYYTSAASPLPTQPAFATASTIVNLQDAFSQLAIHAWHTAGSCSLSITTFAGRLQGKDAPTDSNVSPEGVAHLSQHRLLPMLRSMAVGPGSLARLMQGHRVLGLQQQEGHSTIRLTVGSQAGMQRC